MINVTNRGMKRILKVNFGFVSIGNRKSGTGTGTGANY